MNITRNNLSSNRIELLVVVSAEEMYEFGKKAVTRISEQTNIEGFRPGKASYEAVKAKVGEMAIVEEASRLAVAKTLDKALSDHVTEDWVGQPEITVVKLAPSNDFEYKAIITLVPEVTLGDYKDLGVKAEEATVTDEEVEKVVKHLQESRVKEVLVERAAKIGDKVSADISMTLDNVPLEGGQTKSAAIVLGHEYLVPGFDEKLTGIVKGEERAFQIHYPATYGQKMLADKKVDFKVKAIDVFERELPELNDEFADGFGLKKIDELRENIKKNLIDEKKAEAAHKHEHALLQKIVANSQIGEIPEALIQNETQTMLQELERNIAAQGAQLTQYLMSIGKTATELMSELRPQALERLKTSLALRAIIKAEKIEVSDEEVEAELAELSRRYEKDPKAKETISSPAYRRHTNALLLNRKVVAKLLEWN